MFLTVLICGGAGQHVSRLLGQLIGTAGSCASQGRGDATPTLVQNCGSLLRTPFLYEDFKILSGSERLENRAETRDRCWDRKLLRAFFLGQALG